MKKKCKKCGSAINHDRTKNEYCIKCEMSQYFIREIYLSEMKHIDIKDIQIKSNNIINKIMYKRNILNRTKDYIKDKVKQLRRSENTQYHKIK